MQEILEGQDSNANVIAVEETLMSEATVDVALQERIRAEQRLKVVIDSSPSIKELLHAVEAAENVGADPKVIDAAREVLEVLRARVCARDGLVAATSALDVGKLKLAIAVAETAGVASEDIAQATRVLKEEEPRAEARKQLKNAQDTGNVDNLRAALAVGKNVGLPLEELSPFEELLAGAESMEKAQQMLADAVLGRSVPALKFAIQQAKDCGIDTSEAEDALREEEPKQKAREALATACASRTIEALKGAIAEARWTKLSESEFAEAEELLKREEEKIELLAMVTQVLDESKSADTTSIDSLRNAKCKLSDAIQAAKGGGVAETLLAEAELRRRRIHNGIEDLKGSVRVFCRLRPLSSKETNRGDTEVAKQVDLMTVAVNNQKFNFDAIFSPGTQEEVFDDCRDLVQSAIDGYNVTMFAYGQTGAGKTFTMYGVPGQEGTAPRTINEIYQLLSKGNDRFTYTVMGSMLELYMDGLVDLLTRDKKLAPKLNLRQTTNGSVQIEHLTEEVCPTAESLSELLERGNKHRTTSATAMNDESSRSHSILMVKIVSVNKETKEQLCGKILICDLAGSERLKKSEVTAKAQKEAIEINKSLTALGDVIEAFSQNRKQIPYRNHTLTKLFQDSLGGTAKTLMFVNCSPSSYNEDETCMSLKYATRAKQIKNNVAKRRSSSALEQCEGAL
jgi:protein tyrosine phosphatase (PTP) superfamily phosphohydrolase (DUF442 family)